MIQPLRFDLVGAKLSAIIKYPSVQAGSMLCLSEVQTCTAAKVVEKISLSAVT